MPALRASFCSTTHQYNRYQSFGWPSLHGADEAIPVCTQPASVSPGRDRFLCRATIFLHQIDRLVRQLEQVRMRPVTVGQDRKPELVIAIAQQECRVTRDTAAVREISIAIAHFSPPGQ